MNNKLKVVVIAYAVAVLTYVFHPTEEADYDHIDGYTYSDHTYDHMPPVITEPTDDTYFQALVDASPFNERQVELLQIAYEEGSVVGWPETIQAILLQESSAGVFGPVGDRGERFGKRSYCHMQVKLAAAKDVIRHYKLAEFTTDEELLVALMTDDRFCIRVGAHYFKLMTEQTNTWNEAVVAYNRGVSGARTVGDVGDYLTKVSRRIKKEVRPNEHILVADANNATVWLASN